MKLFKRAQKGFTLVELMVVMAIIAVLAAIVIPPVTGTKQVSVDSQIKQDASAVSSAVGKFNAEQNLAENTANQVAASAAPLAASATETISLNKWPETYIAGTAANTGGGQYSYDFISGQTSTITGGASSNVTAVIILDTAGTTCLYSTSGVSLPTGVTQSSPARSIGDFVSAYNALDCSKLTNLGYIQQTPNGVGALFSTTKTYNNYLWLLKKVTVGTDASAGRVLEVYSLTNVATTASSDVLTYQRIY